MKSRLNNLSLANFTSFVAYVHQNSVTKKKKLKLNAVGKQKIDGLYAATKFRLTHSLCHGNGIDLKNCVTCFMPNKIGNNLYTMYTSV